MERVFDLDLHLAVHVFERFVDLLFDRFDVEFEPSKLFSNTWLALSTAWFVVSRIGFTMKTSTAARIPTATARRMIPEVRLPKSC